MILMPRGLMPPAMGSDRAGTVLELALIAGLIALLVVFAGTGLGERIIDFLSRAFVVRPTGARPTDAPERRARHRAVPLAPQPIPRSVP